jgi:HTH-type transcriptional regulator, transcriptional repressor of NAD biosynthesis genes
MKKAFVLMTALPPTTGHLQLVQFANQLAENGVVVILSTQPDEPFVNQRVESMRRAVDNHNLNNVRIIHHHASLPQDPKTPGFWEMWQDILTKFGVTESDYIVASESYGQKLAAITGAKFYPYDIDRSINSVKATPIRNNPLNNFGDILPEFQTYLRTTVTIFGAESTGKTTLSRELAKALKAPWIFEYARPYLEQTVNEITPRSMTAIWRGQAALQRQIQEITASPYVIQDTDLFSTVGYWLFPHWQEQLGKMPARLLLDAAALQSDLYIFTKSNIPFEKDPLRYGGDEREASDQYWLDICEKFNLNYVILEDSSPTKRLNQALKAIKQLADNKAKLLNYDRHGF